MENRHKINSRQGFISDRIVGTKIPSGAADVPASGAVGDDTREMRATPTIELSPGGGAWERRMSDVFRARQDISSRMSKLLALLEAEKTDEARRTALREEALAFLNGRLEKLAETPEPKSGLELHRYIRDLEHLRLEFFQYAAQLAKEGEAGERRGGKTSFADMAEMKFSTLIRFAFIWSLPLILALIFAALAIGGAVLLAMRA